MDVKVIAGSGGGGPAASLASTLGLTSSPALVHRFPDGEIYVEIDESVRGHDVYVVQSTSPPSVAEYMLEFLLILDAARRTGAGRITAVVPYLGYARQDRRITGTEAIGGRVVADLLGSGAVSRVVALELHNPSVEAFFRVPVENVSCVSLLAEATRGAEANVVVAPDMGAAKLAERFGAVLKLPVAVVQKTRVTGSDVKAHAVVGDVRGKRPLIVDDMISTAGTVDAAARALTEAGCRGPVSVAATHGLLVGPAAERLSGIGLACLWTTNSVLRAVAPALPVREVDVGPLLASVVRRLHEGVPLADFLVHR